MLRATIVLLVFCNTACGIIGPSCVERRQSGNVISISGQVHAGEIVSHRVAYATEGSQNNARFSWQGEASPDGPRLAIYATKAGCANFTLPPHANTGDCAVLARAGQIESGIVTDTLIVTHGRGNPERFGTPPEYIIWVVGDPVQFTGYSLSITWVYPFNC